MSWDWFIEEKIRTYLGLDINVEKFRGIVSH